MYLFRVLIVDDEPMVVDEVSTLLMSWDNMCLDILMAYTAKDALEIVQKGRIDILITDIEMPEMNGLELMKRVSEQWPECKLIILTGYPDFNYAYEAIRNKASAYILKTESDQHLLEAVNKAISEQKDSMLSHGLSEPQRHEVVKIKAYVLLKILVLNQQQLLEKHVSILRNLILYYANPFIVECQVLGNKRDLSLLCGTKAEHPLSVSILNDYLESIQTAFHAITGVAISILCGHYQNQTGNAESDILGKELVDEAREEPLIYVDSADRNCYQKNIIDYLLKYIEDHICNDVTLSELSEVSGYSVDYISKLFKLRLGKTPGQYIASKRVELILQLMENNKLSLERIAEMTGFHSRSYFNHFFKRVFGVSPGFYQKNWGFRKNGTSVPL